MTREHEKRGDAAVLAGVEGRRSSPPTVPRWPAGPSIISHLRVGATGRMLAAVAAAVWLAGGAQSAFAQRSAQAAGNDSGLIIPSRGIVRRGQGRRATVRVKGQDVVALLHAEVGDRRLVILPNGRLESIPAAEAPLTEEPFKPATKQEITTELDGLGLKGFKTRRTKRYLYVYNTSEPFYKGASRILETMYPAVLAYFKRLKLPVHDPQVPLVAVMFRTEEEFQKYDEVPSSIAAYYNTISNQIVMYEQSDLVEVAPELAVKQSISTIAHEGIHQILHNIGVQQRLSRWPMWISEGLAEYFAPTTVGARLRWKGVGKPNDLRMYELNRFMKAGRTKRGEMIEKVVAARGLTSSGYAAAWSLTHYLASRRRRQFQAFLRDVAQLGPLDPREGAASADPKMLFARHFGSDFVALEGGLVKHLRTLPYNDPISNQTHYVVLVDSATLRVAGVTTSPANVRKWQRETLSKLPPATRAATRFQVMPFANKASAERYADRFLGRAD